MGRRLKVIADSDYGKWRDRLDLPTTVKQDRACLALERWGKRFLVDFGYENAQQQLDDLLETRIEEVSRIL